ncbi:4'-phosphopantetheinyl transferase family protein [Flammeovirga pacifica]|uniref:4'-phosphopantetheinyl transferase domain-containing protein n=1 Tax=Flammeovirga pacifica TaxID=915059 RepID=A0A1S1YXG2_FLAPC|nr:4'-phosphopantetheinyl transferase superfamily protein [Flammeovirga pacifica]OHX65706.1 hypothetical protein NH26_04750 [Flammeovirga pacifica]
MPEIISNNINQKIYYSLWRIDESESELLSDIFEEKSEFETIKNQNSRLQTIASRVALKRLLEKHSYKYSGILKNAIGKPELKYLPLSCSISHSKKYVLVCFSDSNQLNTLGCDIEKIQSRILRLLPRVATNNEVNYATDDAIKATQIWTVKEATYKAFGKLNIEFNSQIKSQIEEDEIKKVEINEIDKAALTYQLFFDKHEEMVFCIAYK